MRVLVVMLCCASVAAWAFKPGDSLWARDAETPVFKEANDAKAPLFKLNAGEAVQWLGPSEKDKAFHLVKARGKTGYVRVTSLSPHGPGAQASFNAPPPQLPYETKPSFALGTDEQRKNLAAVEALNRQVAEQKN